MREVSITLAEYGERFIDPCLERHGVIKKSESEVTPEMIEAGEKAWREIARKTGPEGNRHDAEAARYLAMRALEPR